jgi:Domain of unknown function (DUF4118)
MSRLNPLLWPKPPVIWSYGIAVFLVAAVLIVSRWPPLHLQEAPVSLFFCAVMLSAWFGGVGPGLLATALSALAFYCSSPGDRGSRVIAAGLDEPHDKQHRCDEGCGRDEGTRHQVAVS